MLSDQVVFRELIREADLEAVGELVCSTGFFNQEEIEIAVELVKERILKGDDSGYFFLLADLGSKLMGYACYGTIPGSKGSWDLYWIAVHDDFRSKGLGSKILDGSLEKMNLSGGRQVFAETSSREQYHNTHKFYEKNGFVLAARLKNFYDLDDDKLIYVRKFY